MRKMILERTLLTAAFVALIAGPAAALNINQTTTLTDQQSPNNIQTAEPRFTNVIEDLPLMPGLQLVEDEDVLFAEPGQGRIAETNAIGPVDIDDVYKFYSHSLPHLGWKQVNNRTYERERELLRIDAHANEKITTVRFTVKPNGGK